MSNEQIQTYPLYTINRNGKTFWRNFEFRATVQNEDTVEIDGTVYKIMRRFTGNGELFLLVWEI